MNLDTITSVLIRVLDEKRDGLILINGEWGVGKTHFLQKEFVKYYTRKPLFYLSALGLNSLQDFKDRLLSITYLDGNLELDKLGELTSSTASLFTHQETAGKFTEQVISAFSGAMKDYVLKDLSGVIVIDDLERISQLLRNDIATYCLQKYQNDNRLDYILVGNFSKQSKGVLNHKEKVISDEIHYSLNNLEEILEINLKTLDYSYKKTITEVIVGFEETNLRIINRVISKLSPLFDDVTPGKEISEIDIKDLTNSICAHIILKESFHYQECDYHHNYISSSLKTLVTDSKEESELDEIGKREINLLNITAYKNYRNSMVPYCFNLISKRDILPYIFSSNEPLQKHEYAALASPERCNISESDYMDEVEKVILKINSPKLSTWLTATNNYLRLSNSNYIPRITGLTKSKIEKNKISFTRDDIKAFFKETIPNIDETPLVVLKRDGDELYNFFLDEYKKIKNIEKVNKLKCVMIQDGWTAIDMDVYQSKFQYKLLETLDVNLIISAVKSTWSIYDIQLFSNHLSSLYNFSNLSDFLSDELPFLEKLYSSLNSHQKRIPNSFRRGAIIELTTCIKRVKDSLEKSISSKNNAP